MNIILTTQKEAATEDPAGDDIYHVGTLGTVLQLLRLPDGTVKVLIEGLERVKLNKIYNNDDYLAASITVMPEPEDKSPELEGIVRAVLTQIEE